VPYLGWGSGCVDFDNDGWLDLLVVNGHVYPQVDGLQAGAKYRERKLVFLNQRDGTFADVSASAGAALAVPQASRGAAFGDIDNDGDIDVVVENIDGAPMILRNEGGKRQHWITLRLEGSACSECGAVSAKPLRSNREAIGAKVKVITGAVNQTDEVRSGTSYLSQNDLRVHFGLGESEKADRVEIRWPSGKIQTFQNVAADKFYDVREGEDIRLREIKK
jgi:hypothetical protein